MAAQMGLSPEILETDKFPPDKIVNGGGGKNSLMERLRGRVGQHRSWTDTVKTLRLIQMNDKHRQSNSIDKSSLQACLDKLHRAMKITNQQTLIERLDLISRQLGMLFTPPTVSDNQVVLSSEMFKVIVILEGQSGIKDVKISHQDTPTSCEELVDVLRKGDFDEFISHLQGLLSIYSFNGDKKQKSKGYLALSNLEQDLNLIAQLQNSINGVANYIHKSPLGILLPRRGGHPMKLIYYVSPYDLLCKKSKSSYPMTVEAITEHDLGDSVTVCIEPSNTSNKLQKIPLTSVKIGQDGKRMPSVQCVSMINSCTLAASFVLVLPEAVPLSQSIIAGIKEITSQDLVHDGEKPFLSLLLQHSSESKVIDSKELFVTLPDQQHVYYLNQSRDGILSGTGCLVRKIPFTHPTMVPKVLNLLRQQLVFNSILSSIIRPQSRKDQASSVVFELMTVSLQYLSVMFEHPLQHSLITVEFNLSDITNVQCKMCTTNRETSICPDDFISKVFQRCFSVPVMLRSVIKRVQEDIRKLAPPAPIYKPIVKSRWTWHKHTKSTQSMLSRNMTNNVNYKAPSVTATLPVASSPVVISSLPNPPPYPGCDSWVSQVGQPQRLEINKYSIGFSRPFETLNSEPVMSTAPMASEENHDRPVANPLLATLLDASSPAVVHEISVSQSIVNDSPMLSKLLEENTSVATNPFLPPNQRKRLVKRKSSKDVTAGKSPKHRVSESEMSERTGERANSERNGQGMGEKHIDLDSSGGSCFDPVRPPSTSSAGSFGPQSEGSIIDLTDSIGESHVKKLENSLDSFMSKESQHGAMGIGNPLNNQFGGLNDFFGQFHDFNNPNQNPNNPMLLEGSMDFQTPQQWMSRQTPPTPTSRSSPHHGVLPKNEKTSTSLEDLFQGPRGREKDGPTPMHMRRNSQQKRQNFKRQGQNSVESSGGVSPDVFSPLMTSPSHHPLASPGQFPMSSPNYIISPGSAPTMSPSHSSNLTSPILAHVKSEPFLLDPKTSFSGPQPGSNVARPNNSYGHIHSGGKPSLSMLKAQLEQRNDVNKCNTSAILQERDLVKDELSNSSNNSSGSQTPTVKLKLTNYRVLEGVSNSDSEETKSRTSTFDFHSDDEDFDLPMVEKITVVSASPTCLQISNKSTLASFNKFNRSEKFKRKQRERELKNALSLDSGKRKRDKEDKKEKKRKKLNSYQGDEEIVYKSIAVEVGGDNEKPVMPKLKILKKSGKISVESSLDIKEEKVVKSASVAQGKDMKVSESNENSRSYKLDRDAIVKVEKMGKVLKKSDSSKGVKEKDLKHKDADRSSDKLGIPISRTPSALEEGIFDRINAMKSESLGRNEDSNSSVERKHGSAENSPNLNHKKVSKSSSSSSLKSQKSHKRSSSSSKADSQMKTPTIKLKPISFPTSTSSSITVPKTPTTPSTPSTPKNLTHSPTSTTIGKIGAVSLATSGSQKQLTGSSSKSPQGSGSSNKSSNRISGGSLSKLSSSLQKNIQIQGPSGKNSPVPQSKSGHSRSLSTSGVISNSGTSKSEKLNKSLSSSNRTSSPQLEKEKSKSKSSSRDREKSSSSSKSAGNTTPDSAADLLSFLNPKANKIASFTIPKLSSNINTQKASTPTTSATVSVVSTTTAVTFTTTSACAVVNSVAKLSKAGSNPGKSSANSANNASVKTVNSYNKSNANRPHNLNVSNTANNSKGVNSPNSFSQRSNSVYNKSNNPNTAHNQSPGFRNNSGGSNKQSNSNNVTHSQSSWNPSNSSNKPGSNISNGSMNQQNSLKGNSPVYTGSSNKATSASDSVHRVNQNVTTNTNIRPPTSLVPNAPKGPGPPFSQSDSNTKTKSGSQSPASARVRKGSLSAVIDKLTCKASGPSQTNAPYSSPSSTSVTSQKIAPVVIEEPPASPEMDSAMTEMKPEKVVVISEAPASPELDTPRSPESDTVSASKIISIPLENEPQRKCDEISSPTPSPKSLSVLDKVPVPKIIPLNSVKEFAKNSALKSSNSKTDRVNPVSQQNGYLTHHSEVLNDSNKGNNLHQDSYKDFKAPTPKMLENSEPSRQNLEDIENLVIRRRSRSGSKASDPSSPPSSPENGLIIDFPVSPKFNQKSSSPCKVEKSGADIFRTSPNHVKSPLVKTPSKLQKSTSSSPANGENASTGSNENSPGFLEDDLMDEALGLGN